MLKIAVGHSLKLAVTRTFTARYTVHCGDATDIGYRFTVRRKAQKIMLGGFDVESTVASIDEARK